MITLFTIPKPFRGHIAVIQRNAIQSWLKLGPECELILFGDDAEVGEIAEEFNISHVPDVSKTEYGTPLLDFVFRSAQEIARNNTVCYINSDIILMSDFLSAIQEIPFDKFLMIGQRWDLNLQAPWDFGENWEERLRSLVIQQGILHPPSGIDYFAFTKGDLGMIPPFAVGRSGWDNWFIYNARSKKVPVIDATRVITAVHQNHGYSHVPKKCGNAWEGPESDRNIALMGRRIYEWNLEDADWMLCNQRLVKKPLRPKELFRRLTLALPYAAHPALEKLFLLQHRLRYRIKRRE